MAIRLSGIASGLDTDSMVKELVSAYSIKKQKYDKQLQKQEWIMSKWSDVNKKVYGFYAGTLSSMRLSGEYGVKATSISRSEVATITASSSAVVGSQPLSVKQLAASGYLTGGRLQLDGKNPETSTKLSDLGISDGAVVVNGNTVKFTSDMTIGSLMDKFKSAGVNANYDNNTGRIYLSSTKSGLDGEFTITAGGDAGLEALTKLGLMSVKDLNGNETSDMKRYRKISAADYDSSIEVNEKYESKKITADSYRTTVEKDLKTATDNRKTLEESNNKLKEQLENLSEDDFESGLEYAKAVTELETKIADGDKKLEEYDKTISEKQALLDSDDALNAEVDRINGETLKELRDNADAEIEMAKKIVELYDSGALVNSNDAARVTAQDSVIVLNGATYTNNSNSFSINGLSINVTKTTTSVTQDAAGNAVETDDPVVITTSVDTKGMYDKIKGMFSEFNEMITYLDTLYYADSASGYEPLTSDEKEAMTDKQIEEWESKIKTALLRKDSTLSGLTSAMKNALIGTKVTIDGVDYTLSSFGIGTQSYFTAKDETRNNFHIDGDKDDAVSSSNSDKLMAAISADPDKVVKFFTELSKNLYNAINEKMSSTDLSSALTIYNDKEMASQYSDYKDKVSTWEEKIAAYEEKYYKKFSSMEATLSKLQSQQNSLSSLFGSN